MTSRRLFFNAMWEDLRRKSWMIGLSFLANVLTGPVICLMNWEALAEYKRQLDASGYLPEHQVGYILLMYGREALIMSGLVAVTTAVMTGLGAFRFLFHKSSVDLYHGLPVRRSTLFYVCWLDGFLIWFVPFLTCLGMSAAVMGSFFRTNLGLAGVGWELAKTVLSYALVCMVDFLLVYNLVLTAVMFCGNALNAVVGILILGFGGISVWGVEYLFFDTYMETFGPRTWGEWGAVYASPLFSALALLYRAMDELKELKVMLYEGEMRKMLLINLGIAIFLGLCAGLLYMRRPSEHAEQGIRNKAVSASLRMICGVGAGMCGWMLFFLISGNESLFWGCFGVMLAAMLAFGGLDVVFQMDFKAFFSHKLQMGTTLLLSLLLCFCFYQDWLGYDAYLPDKEEIEEIGIYHYGFANREFRYEDVLDKVHLQDMELVYPYLERAAAWQTGEAYSQGGAAGDAVMLEGAVYDVPPDTVQVQGGEGKDWKIYGIKTRVKLKSGRSYYRVYTLPEKDEEILLALLTSQEYTGQTYLLDEKTVENAAGKMTLSRGDSRLGVDNVDPETMLSIVRAYNRDLTENPEGTVLGRGRLLVRVLLNTWDGVVLDVYDDMSCTVEALRQAGYGEWVKVEEASQIASIELGLFYNDKGYSADQALRGEDRVAAARLTYGVYGGKTEEDLKAGFMAAAETFRDTWPAEPGAEVFGGEGTERGSLFITEPKELEELLQWIEYERSERGGSLYWKECVDVIVTARDGRVFTGYLRKGVLPEKYIYRFGES